MQKKNNFNKINKKKDYNQQYRYEQKSDAIINIMEEREQENIFHPYPMVSSSLNMDAPTFTPINNPNTTPTFNESFRNMPPPPPPHHQQQQHPLPQQPVPQQPVLQPQMYSFPLQQQQLTTNNQTGPFPQPMHLQNPDMFHHQPLHLRHQQMPLNHDAVSRANYFRHVDPNGVVLTEIQNLNPFFSHLNPPQQGPHGSSPQPQ